VRVVVNPPSKQTNKDASRSRSCPAAYYTAYTKPPVDLNKTQQSQKYHPSSCDEITSIVSLYLSHRQRKGKLYVNGKLTVVNKNRR
jgi:hypothetical protein